MTDVIKISRPLPTKTAAPVNPENPCLDLCKIQCRNKDAEEIAVGFLP